MTPSLPPGGGGVMGVTVIVVKILWIVSDRYKIFIFLIQFLHIYDLI